MPALILYSNTTTRARVGQRHASPERAVCTRQKKYTNKPKVVTPPGPSMRRRQHPHGGGVEHLKEYIDVQCEGVRSQCVFFHMHISVYIFRYTEHIMNLCTYHAQQKKRPLPARHLRRAHKRAPLPPVAEQYAHQRVARGERERDGGRDALPFRDAGREEVAHVPGGNGEASLLC